MKHKYIEIQIQHIQIHLNLQNELQLSQEIKTSATREQLVKAD